MIQLKVNKVHMLAFILSPTLCCAEMFFMPPSLPVGFFRANGLFSWGQNSQELVLVLTHMRME